MGKQNKMPQQDVTTKIVLATAIIELIEALIKLITKLFE